MRTKFCNAFACGKLVKSPERYCEEHKKARWREQKRFKGNDPLYSSARWKRFRRMYLNRNPICRHCGKLANVVDHIIPRQQRAKVQPSDFDFNNLQPLCRDCHQVKRGRESHYATH